MIFSKRTGIMDSGPAVHVSDYEIFLGINQCREWIMLKYLTAQNGYSAGSV